MLIKIFQGGNRCPECGKEHPKKSVRVKEGEKFREECLNCYTKRTGVSAKLAEKNVAENLETRIIAAQVEVENSPEYAKMLLREKLSGIVRKEEKEKFLACVAEKFGVELLQIV